MKTKSVNTLINSKDFWNKLNKEQQALIDKAIKEADEGKLKGHNEVMRSFRKKYL